MRKPSSVGGLSYAEYLRRWRAANPDKCKSYCKKWYYKTASKEIKERKWGSLKRFMAENPNYAKEWASKNRKRLNEKSHRRRMKIRGSIHPDADIGKIRSFYLNCPDGMEVDHVVPIACGGWHHELNLQYLPMPVNRSKGSNAAYAPPTGKTWMDVPMFLLPESLNKKANAP